MFCQNCGKKLPDGAKFCSSCGTPVPVQEEQETPEVRETLTTPVPEAPPEAAETLEKAPAEEPAAETEEAVPAEEPVPESAPETEEPAVSAVPEAAPVQLEPLAVPKAPVAVTPLPETAAAQGEPILGQKKGRGKALALLGVAAVVVIALVFGVVKLVSGGGGGGGKPAYVYLTGDDELMFLKELKADGEKTEITDEKSGGVDFSPDGKYIYFSEFKDSGYGDLYRMEIARIGKEGAEPQKISSEVAYYEYLPDGRVVFLKGSGEDKQLRFFDGTEDHKLAGGVSDFTVNAESSYVYYTELDNGTYTLSRVPLEVDGEKERLVKDAESFLTSLDANPLVYRQAGSEGSGGTIYTLVPGGEKEKLASDVTEVLDLTILDGGKVRLLYTVLDAEASEYGGVYTIYCVSSGGEKEKLASDVAQIHGWGESGGQIRLAYSVLDTGAEESSYLSYSLYSVSAGGEKEKIASDVDNVYVLDLDNGVSLLYTTMETEEHTLYEFVTDNQAQADANMREPNYEDYQYIDPDSYWGWYTTDWDAYYDAWDVWRGVSSRNSIRQELQEIGYNFLSYTLTRYENGEKTVLMEDAESINVFDPEDGIYIYTKQEGEVRTVADLADLEYSYEIYDLLGEKGSQTWYVNVNGTESELDLDEDYIPGDVYLLNGSQVVLVAYDKEDYEDALFTYTLADSKLTGGGTLTDEPFSNLSFGTSPGGKEGLYYFTDLDEKNSTGELICYTGEKTTIAKEARMVLMLDGKTVFKVDEMTYNDRRGTTEGSFYTVVDGKSTKIADDVEIYNMAILDASQILYIGDGDLYLWNGSESTKLASDVTAFWHNRETAAYDTYTCENYSYEGAPGEDWDYGDYDDPWATDWT